MKIALITNLKHQISAILGTIGILSVMGFTIVSASPIIYAVQGTFPPTTTLSVSFHNQGGHNIIDLKSIGNLTGTITGYYIATGNVTLSNGGTVGQYIAVDNCYCTINGYLYHFSLLERGTVIVTNQRTGAATLNSTSIVIPNNNGISGYISFLGVADVYTFVNSGIYYGQITA